MKTKSKLWDRIRFETTHPDYRPIKFPPPGPYWCAGLGGDEDNGDNHWIIVAYFPTGSPDSAIKKFWPESRAFDRMEEAVHIMYSDRFQKPKWYKK